MNSDSRWLSDSWELFTDQGIPMRISLRSILSQSVLSRYRCVQHDMLRTWRDPTNSAGNKLWSRSEPRYRYLYRAQAGKQGFHITRNNQLWPIRYIRRVAQTGRKQPRRRDASATRNNLVNVGKNKKLDYTHLDLCVLSQNSPNTVTRLSHNSIGHGVVGVTMVVKGCSSQQKKKRKRSKVISVMKNVFWRNSETKKSGIKLLENNHRVKERNVKTAIFLTWELSFPKKHRKKRDATDVLRPRSMTTECTWT